MKLSVIVAVRNAEKWIAQCLQSVQGQQGVEWECLVGVDDPSDDTFFAAGQFQDDRRFRISMSVYRMYPLCNLLDLCARATGDVICKLDGDDYLPHQNVLARIAKEYEDPEVDATHGSFLIVPQMVIPRPMDTRDLRREWLSKWAFHHMLTWRRSLTLLDPSHEAYHYDDGKPIRHACDVAIWYPVVSQARKVVTIFEPTYCYRTHEDNEMNAHRADQLRTEARVGPYWMERWHKSRAA